jgi:hypothetical protein
VGPRRIGRRGVADLRRLLPLAWALLLIAAAGLGVAGHFVFRTPFAPPPEYAQWWAEAACCAGRPQPMPEIRWLSVHGDGFPCAVGTCRGLWQPPNSIVLAEADRMNRAIVAHEMLHMILPEYSHGDSTLEAVLDRCARGK